MKIVSFSGGWGPTVFDFFKYSANAANGATLLDVAGGHVFDLVLYILGPVASLSAVVINHHPSSVVIDPMSGKPTGENVTHDGQSQVCVTGLLKTGSKGEAFETPFTVHLQSGVKEAEFSWIISGENGTIRVQADPKLGFFDPSPEMYFNGEKVKEVTKDDRKIALAWEAFADGKNGMHANVEDVLKAKEVMVAVMKSSKEGRRIDLL
ncbi:hypothetical protein BT96DRAFT_543214 [Gymnopus androsaceus JB14]|uniref:Gal80p-like C-terminal domain-containing protein n=1 Tax=Gymnopus androsaceus JB14 TaxID=1447944 RepID=A0A6A4HXZ5_9AGAR|nr:hypothetical protein BT96DRAFT_543214 [Gymnopus androsaceus JB14]